MSAGTEQSLLPGRAVTGGERADRLSWAALLTGAAVFLLRGIYRSLRNSSDYSWNYLSTRSWLHGGDPYNLAQALAQRPGDFPQWNHLQGVVTPYPPAVFPISAPFAVFGWTESAALFVVASALLWVLAMRELAAEFAIPPVRCRYFYALALAAYPIDSGLSLGQFAAPAIALLIMAWCRLRKTGTVSAGVLACLSMAVKPQIGAIFIALALLERRWRPAAIALLCYALLTVVGIAPLVLGHVLIADLSNLMSSVHAVYGQQSQLTCCVNLRMITRNLPATPPLMPLLELLVLGAFAVALLVRCSTGKLRGALLFVAVYLLFLLAMYHRPYDLAGLVVALAWLLSDGWHERLAPWLAATLGAIFQPVPTTAFLGWLGGRFSPAVTPHAASWFTTTWLLVLIPHVTWMLVLAFALIMTWPNADARTSSKRYSGCCGREAPWSPP